MSVSNQWSPLQDTVSPYGSESSPLTSEQIQRHSLNTRDIYEIGSQSTGSSGNRKDLSPYSLSDHGGHYLEGKQYLPNASSSVSGEDPWSQSIHAADVLEAVHHRSRMTPRHHNPHGMHSRPHNLQYQFSQESEQFGSSSSTSLPYSQSSGHSGYHRSYHNNGYKRSSPSGSDIGSLSSSVQNRLGSGPASQASFSSISLSQSTSSSRNGYVYRLPRPSLTGSNPGSATNLIPSRFYQSPPSSSSRELINSDIGLYNNQRVSRRVHHKQGDISEHRRKDNRGERDSLTVNLDMVRAIMSSLASQSDSEAVKVLLTFSQTPDNCIALRECMCINLIVKILHNTEQKGSKEHGDVRAKAAETLQNIVEANPITSERRSERQVLKELEKVRLHCDSLYEFISRVCNNEPISDDHIQSLQSSCNLIVSVLKKIFMYSSSKEHHRPAILNLGGLQTMAEVLIVDQHLPSDQQNKKIVRHSSDTISIIITILINLTYGDIYNKQRLCGFTYFLSSLMHHIRSMDEQILSKGAQVLRNLSCKATRDMKDGLLKCNASIVLMEAVEYANGETTTQHITSALWNLSAHSTENRHSLCQTKNGIELLVGLLSYNSPSGATVVIENVGGVLKNLSSVISQEEEYRKRFRQAGGLAKLVQHLKSKNRTVLANATGILWNISARCPENQKLLWDLGSIPLLDVLQSSKQRNIAENARGALRNLLAFGHSNGWTSKLSTPPSVHSNRAYSKSINTLSGTHSLSQSSNGNETDGRRSAPNTGSSNSTYDQNLSSHNSTSSLKCNGERDLLRKIRSDKMSPHSAHSNGILSHHSRENNNFSDKQTTRPFTRVLSAPHRTEERESEWMYYRPGAKQESPLSSKFSAHVPSVPTVHSSQHKKKSNPTLHQLKLSNGQYPYSQTESVESTEFQSISAVSLGLSPQLLTEMLGESGKPSTQGEAVTYHDLDVESEEEENESNSLHLRHSSEGGSETSEHFSIADQFAQNRGSIRKSEYVPPTTSSIMSSPSLLHTKTMFDLPRTLGTSGLALDGTTQEGLESISETSDRSNSFSCRQEGLRSHSSSISSSTSKDTSTDI